MKAHKMVAVLKSNAAKKVKKCLTGLPVRHKKNFQKSIDKSTQVCYNTNRKKEEDRTMTKDYYEAHEAEYLEMQELMEELFAEEVEA